MKHDVIIIGSGPAGLAAATELRRLGIRDVVVLEREQTAGGVPRHCGHPGFGWRECRRLLAGPAYAQRLVAGATGVDLRTGTTALRLEAGGRVHTISSTGPAVVEARHVLLAMGTRETPRSARLISGTRPWGVFTTGALQQLVYLAGVQPCTSAVIVGTELVSFSNLLTMRHARIRPLAMIEAGERIVAPRPGDWIARLAFGARVLTRSTLVAVHGDQRVSGVDIETPRGRETIECDGVVFSGGFVPETEIVRTSHLAIDPATGGPVVDQYGRCSDPAWFAAGNLLRPVEASWTAWSEGRAVAHAIAASLRGALPVPTHQTVLEAAGLVRYVCPQRLSHPSPLAPALPVNVRVSRAGRGRLRMTHGKRELWGQVRSMLPERRLLIPAVAADFATLDRVVVDLALPAAR